jgi:hypothetical protein
MIDIGKNYFLFFETLRILHSNFYFLFFIGVTPHWERTTVTVHYSVTPREILHLLGVLSS